MKKWLDNPELLEADEDCEYAEVIEIDLAEIKAVSYTHLTLPTN